MFTDDVAEAANRPDYLVFMPIIDLGPKMTDVHIDNVRGPVETLVPDMFEDHGAREDSPRVRHQILKDTIFFRGQLDSFAGAFHLLRKAIQFQIPYSEHTCSGDWAAGEGGL